METCDGLYDKLEVMETWEYPYKENGIGLYLRFQGLNEDPGQFEIVSSDVDPLTADNLTIEASTLVPYGTNLFYEPIPFEMLKTYETKPQIIVSVDGLPAVCHNLTCDFTYVAPVGSVTAFTFDSTNNKLVLTGTEFPTTIGDIREVVFAKSKCAIDESTLSATNLECTLVRQPTCGNYLPIFNAKLGKIPNAASLVEQVIACTISGSIPNTNLNLLGGDNITLSGTNFPHDLTTSTVEITFNDAQSTKCQPQISSTGELVCLTSAFD